ncbi:hypothetical protein ACIPZG_23195 [Pseudomonas sp. NPDC089395]|uniref:hypothetical protein n=1 Tax=Pseudomonas sp. NPDC089395 TaxID=3364460 RepID=UPI0037F427CD
MTNIQTLKDEAFAQYQKHGRYHIILSNYFPDMFERYDALVAQGYTRADDSFLIAANMNLAAQQVVYMIKPADVQQVELQAIYDKIEEDGEE